MVIKKGQLEAAKNMAIHGASMLPVGGIFAAGGNKLKKMTSKVSTFNKSKVDEYGINRNFRKSTCLLYTSPSPRDRQKSRMPSSA